MKKWSILVLFISMAFAFSQGRESAGTGESKKMALRSAYRKVISQVIADNFEQAVLTKNRRKIRHFINKKQESYIEKYEIVSESYDEEEEITLVVKVCIDEKKLCEDFAQQVLGKNKVKRNYPGVFVLCIDPEHLEVAENAVGRENCEFMRTELADNLRGFCKIHDATLMMDVLKRDVKTTKQDLLVYYNDKLSQEFNLSTHFIYYWVKIHEVKRMSFRDYWAESGVRVIQKISGRELMRFTQASKKIRIMYDERKVRHKTIVRAARAAVQKIIKGLPTVDNIIVIKAVRFQPWDLDKIEKGLLYLKRKEYFKIEQDIVRGDSYLSCQVTCLKGQSNLKQGLLEILRSYGVRAVLHADIGKIKILPRDTAQEDEFTD